MFLLCMAYIFYTYDNNLLSIFIQITYIFSNLISFCRLTFLFIPLLHSNIFYVVACFYIFPNFGYKALNL